MELFNEITTLILSSFMFIYTDFVSDPQTKQEAS